MKASIRRYLTINALILVVLAAAFAILDATLRLGKFHGLVFSLYLFYAAIVQSVVNLVLALVHYLREHRPRALAALVSALFVALSGSLLAYGGAQLVELWLR